MLRTLTVILLLPGCARLAVSLNRAEEKGSKAFADDDEQAEGLSRVLEDCIGGESEDVLYDDDVVDDEEEYVDDDSDDGDGDY